VSNASFSDLVFKVFTLLPNRFKYCQNACFRDLVFKIVSEVVPNRVK